MERVSIAEARQNLPALIHEVERAGPLQLTRRGTPVAVLVSQQEYDRLVGTRRMTLGEAILSYQASRDPDLEDGDEFENLRDPHPGRDFHWPE